MLLHCISSFNHYSKFSVAGMGDSGVFTSPEVAKSFDFTAEERIYKW